MRQERPKDYFSYNKKRKHYAYIFKQKGDYRKNLLLSTKRERNVKIFGKRKKFKNVPLFEHPNPNKRKLKEKSYLMTQIYTDHKNVFDYPLYKWNFHSFDKRKVKKIKKRKWK